MGAQPLQAYDQPLRPPGLHQHCYSLARRFSVRLGWQGRRHDALGTFGRQAPLLA